MLKPASAGAAVVLGQTRSQLPAEAIAKLGMVPARDVDALQSCQRNLQDQAMEQLRFGLPGWGKDQRQQKQGT